MFVSKINNNKKLIFLVLISYFIQINLADNNETTYYTQSIVDITPQTQLYFKTTKDCNIFSCHMDLDILLLNRKIEEKLIRCIGTRIVCGDDYYKEKYTKINFTLNETLKGIFLANNIYIKKE